MVESSELPMIAYTDHAATLEIVKQTSLNTVSVEKLNLRLVRASEYLQCFRLDVRHKPSRTHFVSDALSRLSSREAIRRPNVQLDEGILNTLHARTANSWTLAASIVELSDNFKKRLIEGYDTDPGWKRILEMFKTNENLPEQDASTLPFERHDDKLIY